MQSFIMISTTLKEGLRSQEVPTELRSQEVPIVYIPREKNYYVHNMEKLIKINLSIIPKWHAHHHTMKKAQA